ncbi:hypothetical protein FACS1894182_08920 [Bacteroidia bacterium]|nr:hypothetical protein FACS1894182_08920 [Bacteroidia bacterium]
MKTAVQKYHSYSDEWEKAYFDPDSGGFNIYHKDHKFSALGGGGEAEKTVGKILAKRGRQIEFLPEGEEKSADIRFDKQTWDIKYIDHANEETIRNYIKDARKADNVIFYYTKDKYLSLDNAIVREVGKYIKENRVHELPNIYYIDLSFNELKLLWKK